MKSFTLHVMNLKYRKVSLFEISYKNKWIFHHIQFFLDVPVLPVIILVDKEILKVLYVGLI